MRIGGALFLIAVGAILKWAVHKHVSGLNIHVLGLILLLIGIVGLLFEIGLMFSRRRTTVVQRSDDMYVDDPANRY